MTKGQGHFSDIGKKAKDILNKDYISNQRLTVSSGSGVGVALTSTVVKKRGLSTGTVAAQCKYKNSAINVIVDTESNIFTTLAFKDIVPSSKTFASFKLSNSGKISTTLTFNDIVPSTKTIASFKLPDFNSSKLKVQYFHDHATVTTVITLKKSPIICVSATIGTPAVAFSAEAGYDATSGRFTKYTAGIGVTRPNSYASIILGDNGDNIRASYVHHLDQSKKSIVAGEISRRFSTNEISFMIGGSFVVDLLTQVKARLNNHGKLGALLQHEVIPKSVLTISGEIDTMALDKYPKFELAIALKP